MIKSFFLVAAALAAFVACGGTQPEPSAAPPVASSPGSSPAAAAPPAATDAPVAAAPSAATAPEAIPETSSSAAPSSSAPAGGNAPEATEGVQVGEVQVTGGTLPNLPDVVAKLRTGLSGCIARGGAQRPDAEGQVTLTIRVGAAGQVLGVAAQQTTKIPAPMVSCMSTRAATAQFEPPRGAKGQVSVVVPVTVPKP